MEDKKDKNKGQNWGDTTAYSKFFGGNHFHAFFVKKTEKIVSAIYLITNYVSEGEPLRVRLREKSLDLMSDSLSLKAQSQKINPEAIENTISSIFEIVALVEVGYASGYISEMNFSILKNECTNLANTLERKGGEISGSGAYISSDFLSVPDLYLLPSLQGNKEDGLNEGNRQKQLEKRVKSSKNTKIEVSGVKLSPKKAKLNDRRDQIFKLLGIKNKITVKDVSEIINDCSEKTLQRELMSLVDEGVLKKEGEKRWSSYSRT